MKRRQFISNTAKTAGSLIIGGSLAGFNIISRKGSSQEKLGIALVGLGRYSNGRLGPALLQTKWCELRGIVSGTPEKRDTWADQYNIPDGNIYGYDNFDEIADNPDIDIIYIVLPNSMHVEYTIRAAQAGKHVICEKPMATSYADCVRMVEVCKKAGKKLSMGYRLHFEPHHLEVMRLGQKEVFGKVKEIEGGFGFSLKDKNRWRLNKEMAGGGPLMDVGVYAVQSTLYSLGQLPKSLKAADTTIDKEFFGDIEGSIEADFFFKSGIKSKIKASYETYFSYIKAVAESGSWELEPAYSSGTEIVGKTHLGSIAFPKINQQAAQMDDFARCILEDRESIVPGEMGARDLFILEKIYESAYSGKEVSLKGIPKVLHLV